MKKYFLILLALITITLPAVGQTLYLCEIYYNVFDTHYLLHFCIDKTLDVFVISEKVYSGDENTINFYDSLQTGMNYDIIIHQLDSIPTTLRPVHGFNVRGKPIDSYSIRADSRCSSISESIYFFDYRKNVFMIPLYESPDIIGLQIKTGRARKE